MAKHRGSKVESDRHTADVQSRSSSGDAVPQAAKGAEAEIRPKGSRKEATDAEYLKAHKINAGVAEQATYGSVDERIQRQAYNRREAAKKAAEVVAQRVPKKVEPVPYPAHLTGNQKLHKHLTAAKHECDKQNAKAALLHIQAAISIIESLIDDSAIKDYRNRQAVNADDETLEEGVYDPDAPPEDYQP